MLSCSNVNMLVGQYNIVEYVLLEDLILMSESSFRANLILFYVFFLKYMHFQ